jgi:Bacterial protein of unknown function (DUF961).
MRLAEDIKVNVNETFGELLFSAMRRENKKVDKKGDLTEEIEKRTYDLKCKKQGMMIQVSLPPEVEKKEYEYNAVVELVEPKLKAVANNNFPNVEVNWYINAKDIILKNTSKTESNNNQFKKK